MSIRTFTLNSDEAYAALCPRPDEPWIRNGSLPREPRVWERSTERSAADAQRRRSSAKTEHRSHARVHGEKRTRSQLGRRPA